MSYQPIIPFSGLAGWNFLNRTREVQQDAFDTSATMARDVKYFKENIGNIATAEQLVSDRRLLSVALGAFGLDADINNKFFVKKVLDDGTLETTALANRLSDKRYLEFSKAFGFGDFDTPSTVLSDFPEKITNAYKQEQFAAAVGEQDTSMRLALGFQDDIADVLKSDTTENGKWYGVMGSSTLRSVFETALGLPSSFSGLDLDQQLSGFREKLDRVLGDSEIDQLSDPEKQEKLVRLFLIRSEIATGSIGTSSSAAALTLLQSASF